MKTNALTRMAYHNDPEAVRVRKKREYHRNKIRAEVEGLKTPALRTIVKAVGAVSPTKAAKLTKVGDLIEALMDAVNNRGLEAKTVRAHLPHKDAATVPDPSVRRTPKRRKRDFSGTERDGHQRGGGGEGPHHQRLRKKLTECPSRVKPGLRAEDTHTEYELPSGDRVDVLVCQEQATLSIEVKSKISNEADLERGVYQCVKYRAVLEAQQRAERQSRPVEAWLVVERRRPNKPQLPQRLKELARQLDVRTKELNPLSP